jgi:rhamnose transport system ATP-binding protein
MTDEQHDPEPIIEVRGVSRRFGSTQALDGASLALYPGEVHALIGENGAGKSTLIKVMTGVEQPDTGELVVDGQARSIASALDAQALGIVAIYQEPMVFPDLSVAENVFISHRDRGRIVNRGQNQRDAKAVFQRLGVELDVEQPASGLTVAEQQTVEIAKALSLNARVLIMDEPTSSLSANETGGSSGSSSRSASPAWQCCSSRIGWTRSSRSRTASRSCATGAGSGRPNEASSPGTSPSGTWSGATSATSSSARATNRVRSSSRCATWAGRVSSTESTLRYGPAKSSGSPAWSAPTAPMWGSPCSALRQPTPARSRSTAGRCGSPAPNEAMRHGIAYVTEDRHGFGLVLPLSIAANLSLPSLARYTGPAGLLNRGQEAATAREYRDRLSIRTASIESPAGSLSGGNQQKVMLGEVAQHEPAGAHPR